MYLLVADSRVHVPHRQELLQILKHLFAGVLDHLLYADHVATICLLHPHCLLHTQASILATVMLNPGTGRTLHATTAAPTWAVLNVVAPHLHFHCHHHLRPWFAIVADLHLLVAGHQVEREIATEFILLHLHLHLEASCEVGPEVAVLSPKVEVHLLDHGHLLVILVHLLDPDLLYQPCDHALPLLNPESVGAEAHCLVPAVPYLHLLNQEAILHLGAASHLYLHLEGEAQGLPEDAVLHLQSAICHPLHHADTVQCGVVLAPPS